MFKVDYKSGGLGAAAATVVIVGVNQVKKFWKNRKSKG